VKPGRLAILVAVAVAALLGVTSSAAAEGVVPVEGGWVGMSSDQFPVTFYVVGGQVVDAHFSFKWGFCGAFSSTNSNKDPIDPAAGTWSYLDPHGPHIEGTFVGPETVEGKVVAPTRELPGCPETVATFTAAPGIVPPPPKPRHLKTLAVDSFKPIRHSERPHTIVLDFYDLAGLYDLHWASFGGRAAHGSGRALIEGRNHVFRPHVRLTLSDPTVSENHRYREYAFLTFGVHGPVPHGFPRHLVLWMLGQKAEYPPG
jgi:hypothetical protein